VHCRLICFTHVFLEPNVQLLIPANEGLCALQKELLIDQILREEVAQLQELIHGVLVAEKFLHPIKECNLILVGVICGRRRQRFRLRWCQGGRDGRAFRDHGFGVACLCTLSNVSTVYFEALSFVRK
jgi:hypothetical protein